MYSKEECLGFSPAILTSVLPAISNILDPGAEEEKKKERARQERQAQQFTQLQVQQAVAAEKSRQEEQRRRDEEYRRMEDQRRREQESATRTKLYVGVGAAALLGIGGVAFAFMRRR